MGERPAVSKIRGDAGRTILILMREKPYEGAER
jgi:hypothetical protein